MRWSPVYPSDSLVTSATTKEAMAGINHEAAPMVCDHHRGQHPSEPLNSHEERNLVMRHEPSRPSLNLLDG